VDADDDARTIGARLRQIRNSRKKGLRVIAGLAGVSKSKLSQIERGERALDSRSDIVALANALQIAPSELTRRPEPTAGNGEGPAVKAVRRALIAVSRDDPAGQVVPVDVLRTRVEALVADQRQCEHEQVGRELPELIRDLHTTMAAGRDVGELLGVAVMLHVQGSHAFLHDAARTPTCAGRPQYWRGRPPGNTAGLTCLAWPRSARRTGCSRPGSSTWHKPSWTR
jgi:transcriptional regulator with XRE-family HTH domain